MLKSYIDLPNIKKTRIDQLRQFLLFLSLSDSMVVDGLDIKQNETFDYLADSQINIDVFASNLNINVLISLNDQNHLQFSLVYDDDEMDWVFNGECILCNSPCDPDESWRLLDELREVTQNLESKLEYAI